MRRLTADLIGYQNAELGATYLDTVERVATAEQTVSSGSTKLTHAVAVNLHKLLAYKDEYEVARLMLDDDAMRQAYEIAGADGRVAWQLHPPMLRALGVQRKLSFGARTAPAFRLLARGKRLRGTAFDPFRWSKVRRLERQLPGEYRATIASLLDALTVGNLAQAVDIAGLPDVVRGYEHLKLARAATYRRNTAEALAAFRSGGG